jgi:GT2 family glycosyltransferase
VNKISVIIVSWNARAYLRDCLASVRATGRDDVCETIVIDNASADGSAEMVSIEFPEVVLIRSDVNLGFAAANNLGVQRARGEVLALVNSDVVLHPNCLQILQAFLERHEDVGIVGPKIVGRDGQLQSSCRRLPTVWNNFCRAVAIDRVFSRSSLLSGHEMRHFDHDVQAEPEVLSGCLWVVRTKAAKFVGALDERFFFYMEDVDWCRRFRSAGWRLVFVPQATATHYGAGSSANAPLRYSLQYHRASLTYWKKYHGIVGGIFYRSIALTHHGLRFVARSIKRLLGRQYSDVSRHKLQEDWVCLRWLLTGKGL